MFPLQQPGLAAAAAPTAPASPAGGQPSAEELLNTMLELALVYRAVEKDPGDLLKMERATTLIQQVLADRSGQQDRLLGGNASAIRRLTGA